MAIKLQTNETDFEHVNVTVKFKDMPKELQQYVRVALYNNTSCYKWEGQPDWDNLENSTIGLQIYKDYYNCLALFYKSKDGYYSSVGIGKLFNDMQTLDLTEYVNCIYPISTVTEQLSVILPMADRKIIHNYDYEQLMDAINCGDVATLEDIVGDRDIFELL